MSVDDFLSGLDPKIAKMYRTAQETEVIRMPVASERMNRALGGGMAKGRLTTIYGNQSAGKSMAAMQTVAKWQREFGYNVAWADVEGVWDKEWAGRLGVDNSNLILIQKKSAGAITDILVPLIEQGIDAVWIDSISDILPEAFVDSDGGIVEFDKTKQIGQQARSITKMINALQYTNNGTTALGFISQTTTEIGQTYTKQVPHGGKKLLFASSQIIKLTSSPVAKEQIVGDKYVGDRILQMPIGRKVEGVVEKNKLGPQSRTFEYDIYYDGAEVGIDAISEIVKDCVAYGIIKKGGAWFNYGDRKWQGEPSVVRDVKAEPDLKEELQAKLDEFWEAA